MALRGVILALFALAAAESALLGQSVAEVSMPLTVAIPAGSFIQGSKRPEREAAYRLDEAAYGHSVTRRSKWYEDERYRKIELPAFQITRNLVTNRDYARFVTATGHPAPEVKPDVWKNYQLIHPYGRTRRHAWKDGAIPEGRADHPVVMVAYTEAVAYARWLSTETGVNWRLPSEAEWEKAARGTDGRRFPWGDDYDPKRLNSHDDGPFDTVPVGSFPDGASPFGMLDPAGQVFEWTATAAGKGRHVVKGGSWDDSGCGICRPAARHTRPDFIKHILVGFRLVRE